jgi:hypothetical protein
MPWYIGPKGEEIAYDDPGAVPISLEDVPNTMGILNEERLEDWGADSLTDSASA